MSLLSKAKKTREIVDTGGCLSLKQPKAGLYVKGTHGLADHAEPHQFTVQSRCIRLGEDIVHDLCCKHLWDSKDPYTYVRYDHASNIVVMDISQSCSHGALQRSCCVLIVFVRSRTHMDHPSIGQF